MADPEERPIKLTHRQASILLSLVQLDLDRHGAEVAPETVRGARMVLAGTSAEELAELALRLEMGLRAVWDGAGSSG